MTRLGQNLSVEQRLTWYLITLTILGAVSFVGLSPQIGSLALPMMFGAIIFLVLQLNFRVAFLVVIAVIPNLGEIETDQYISIIWMIGFVPLATAWILNLAFRPRELFFPLIPSFLLLLLVSVMVISHLGGYDLEIVAMAKQGAFSPWWPTVDLFVALAIGFMSMSVFRNESDLRNIYLMFMLSGVPYAITIFFFGYETDPLTGVIEMGGRTQGFYGHPHMASTHMIVCAILSANFVFYTTGWLRWFSIACTVMFLLTLAFASSKTTMAAIPLVTFAWVSMMISFKRAFLFVIGMVVLIAISVPFLPGSLQRDVITIAEAVVGDGQPHARTLPGEGRLNTLKERFIQIDEAVELVKDRPWLGYGPGRVTFVSQVPALYAGPQIHNYYVQTFVEGGVLGGMVLLLFVMSVLLMGFFNALALKGEQVWHLIRGLFLAALMISLIVTLNSGSVGLRIFWAMFGLLAGTERLLRNPGTVMRTSAKPKPA